jgi:hypothetical protein
VTIKVKLSDLRRVGITPELFHNEMRHWRAHMQFVEAEKMFPLHRPDRSVFDTEQSYRRKLEQHDAAMLQRHVAYAGPHDDPRFTFEATAEAEPFYEIVDDTGDAGAPPPTG